MLYLSSLPQDGREYILKWVGAPSRHPIKEDDYLIKLVMSPLIQPAEKLKDLKYPKYRFDKFVRHQNIVIDSLFGLTPFFPLGSVWKDGFKVLSRVKLTVVEFEFNFGASNFRNLSPLAYDECGGFSTKLIPSTKWCLSGGNLNKAGKLSGLMVLTINNGIELLIPHYEIMRAFYCHSSTLSIFFASNHLSDNQSHLFDHHNCFIDSQRTGHFFGNKKLDQNDCKTVALSAFNDQFRRRLTNHRNEMFFDQIIQSGGTKDTNNFNQSSNIKFPLDGDFKVKANGLWVDNNLDEEKRFMVINFLEVDYDLGFDKLNVNQGDKKYISPENSCPSRQSKPTGQNVKSTNEDDKKPFIFDEETDPNLDNKLKSDSGMTAIQKNLSKLKVKNIRIEQEIQNPRKSVSRPKDFSEVVSTGNRGKSSSNTTKLECVTGDHEGGDSYKNTDKFQNLELALKLVKLKLVRSITDAVAIETVKNKDTVDNEFYAYLITDVIDNKKYSYPWSFMSKKPPRMRRFFIKRLCINAFNIYFVEIESKVDEYGNFSEPFPCFIYHNFDGSLISNNDFKVIIESNTRYKCGIAGNGWWGKIDLTDKIIKKVVRHRFHRTMNLGGQKIKARVPMTVSSKNLAGSIMRYLNQVLPTKSYE